MGISVGMLLLYGKGGKASRFAFQGLPCAVNLRINAQQVCHFLERKTGEQNV
jgi:hypothetical protein